MLRRERFQLAANADQLLARRLPFQAQRIKPLLELLNAQPVVILLLPPDEPLARLIVTKDETPEIETVGHRLACAEASFQIADLIDQLFMQQQQKIQGRGAGVSSSALVTFAPFSLKRIPMQGQLSSHPAEFLPDAADTGGAVTRAEMWLKQARHANRVQIIQVVLWRWLFNHQAISSTPTIDKRKERLPSSRWRVTVIIA